MLASRPRRRVRMNLFIIPTWYPSARTSAAGLFTREQASAIAKFAADIRVLVSTWGHDSGAVSLRSPRTTISAVKWRLRQPTLLCRDQNGAIEIGYPALTWSRKLPGGGFGQLLRINRRNLRVALDRHGPIDLIHAHVSYPAGYIAAILSREFDIPYVLTEHMGPFPFERYMHDGRPISEIDVAFRDAVATIAVSPFLAERIASFGYHRPEVVPNLVDEDRFLPAAAHRKDRFTFLTLCSMSSQKGVGDLLEAIALWRPSPDRVRFRIAGDGPLRASLQRLARRLGLESLVEWLGHADPDRTPALYAASDAFIMTSRYETFGVVYAEAIACGVPVIATRCGGPQSIVNSTNGMLVDVGDRAGIADAMERLVADPGKFDSRVIREDFMQRFSRPAVVRQLCKIYERVAT